MAQASNPSLNKRVRSSADDAATNEFHNGRDVIRKLAASCSRIRHISIREDDFIHGDCQKALDYILLTDRNNSLMRSLSFPLEHSKASVNLAAAIRRYIESSREASACAGLQPTASALASEELSYTFVMTKLPDKGAKNVWKPEHSTSPSTVLERDVSACLQSQASSASSGSLDKDANASTPRSLSSSISSSSSLEVLDKQPSVQQPAQTFSVCVSECTAEGNEEPEEKGLVRSRRCFTDDRCPPFGTLSVCGRRREMEDTCTVEPDFVLLPCDAMGGCCCDNASTCTSSSLHFFGVYDGHGGTQVSSFCKIRLHKVLAEELIKAVRSLKKGVPVGSSEWCLRWEKVMVACFQKIDEEVGGICPTGVCSSVGANPGCCTNPIAPDNVGSTAVVAVIGACQIIVGNCGDSRAVLSRGGKAIPLSRDHKPDREDEMDRIEAAGGRVIYWDGYRVGGLLAMSRAIGDRFLKQYVIGAPEVRCIQRTQEDECLILGSDGLWDAVSNEMACDIARRCLKSHRRKCARAGKHSAEDSPAGAAAALLTKLALSRGSKDNITVVVVDLKAPKRQLPQM